MAYLVETRDEKSGLEVTCNSNRFQCVPGDLYNDIPKYPYWVFRIPAASFREFQRHASEVHRSMLPGNL